MVQKGGKAGAAAVFDGGVFRIVAFQNAPALSAELLGLLTGVAGKVDLGNVPPQERLILVSEFTFAAGGTSAGVEGSGPLAGGSPVAPVNLVSGR
jgi:hypothetical protein